jgi:hypothetical protein
LVFQSDAISWAILFSKPSPFWLEKGMLSGSLQTRRRPGWAGLGRWAWAEAEIPATRMPARIKDRNVSAGDMANLPF